ncbi:MAG: hypothetical protein M1819_006419 [Sarea resinae]|nr:MAG: hypothetical protein M1819_006419 [Sarea resinae]
MTRSSAAKKQSANQHSSRHENGLAAPGKRIRKQKSNGLLNGAPNGQPVSCASRPSTPASTQPVPIQHASGDGSNGSLADVHMLGAGKLGPDGSGRRCSDGSSDGAEAYQGDSRMANGVEGQPHRRIDVNATKNPAVHDIGTMSLASTVLRSCPLGDTIAILIILLQLPPAFLTITHFLFTTLTFVPPSGSSISSVPSLNDIFQGSGGTPSLATIVIADIVFLIFWLFLWAPAQSFALDLAQAVIAISLGGGYTGKGGGSNSTVLCVAIIGLSHLIRRKDFRRYGLSFILSLTSGSPSAAFKLLPRLPDFHHDAIRTTSGWVQSILAVHILTQGVVRMVRRWISKREMAPPSSSGKRTDPEAAAAAASQGQSGNYAAADSSNDMANSNADGQVSAPNPTVKDGKEKMSSGKKKRKQATHVRSQQPFWAALASTKVIVLKEYEQSQATAEAAGSKATDVNNLGSAPFDLEEGRVWVTHVGSTEVYFNTSYFSSGNQSLRDGTASFLNVSTGIDKSKPFYVRVNGADWASTRICKYQGQEDGKRIPTDQWAGEIFGLTALTSYCCEFIRSADDEVIYSASITTSPAPTAEQTTSVPTPAIHQSLRPSSPTTTLKNSNAAAESRLNDSRARLKRSRKEHKSSSTALKREVENYSSRLGSSGSGDDRLRQRVLQITQHIRQAEEAAASISSQIEAMGSVPEEDVEEWKTSKAIWEQEKHHQSAARNEYTEAKLQADRQVSSVQSEASTAQQKRDRLQTRHTRLDEQHNRITSANAQGTDEKERRIAEAAAKEAERQQTEQQFIEQINTFGRQTQDTQFRSQQAWQHIHQLEVAFAAQQQQMNNHSPTTSTPEVGIPAAAAPTRGSFGFQFPAFGALPSAQVSQVPTTQAQAQTQPSASAPAASLKPDSPYRESRGRSSSMLSNVSGFTDFSDDAPSPHHHHQHHHHHHHEHHHHHNGGNNHSHHNPFSAISNNNHHYHHHFSPPTAAVAPQLHGPIGAPRLPSPSTSLHDSSSEALQAEREREKIRHQSEGSASASASGSASISGSNSGSASTRDLPLSLPSPTTATAVRGPSPLGWKA